jgi:hypothetical protein
MTKEIYFSIVTIYTFKRTVHTKFLKKAIFCLRLESCVTVVDLDPQRDNYRAEDSQMALAARDWVDIG